MLNQKIFEIKKAKRPVSIISTLEELMADLENDKVSDFIIISRVKSKDSDAVYDGYQIKYNWMGRESTITSLSLLDYMREKISEYIFGR
jgi:hypothetical protein